MLAFLGLHLKPPVRELTRDAVAVEARTLARALGLTLRALPRAAGAGPIGRAALGFTVLAEGRAPEAGDPGGERVRRLARGLTRIRAVAAVSLLVRPPGPGDAGLSAAARLPTVAVDAAEFEPGGPALLPDRLYLVSDESKDRAGEPLPRAGPGRPAAPRRATRASPPRALRPGHPGQDR